MAKKSKLDDLFGKNWHVKAWATTTALFAFITLNPDSLNFLPEDIQATVKGVAAFITLYAGSKATGIGDNKNKKDNKNEDTGITKEPIQEKNDSGGS